MMWSIFYVLLLSGLVAGRNVGYEYKRAHEDEQIPMPLSQVKQTLSSIKITPVNHEEKFDKSNSGETYDSNESETNLLKSGIKPTDEETMQLDHFFNRIRRSPSPSDQDKNKPPTSNHIRKNHSGEGKRRHYSHSSSSSDCSSSSSSSGSSWSSSPSGSSSSSSWSSSPECSSSSESKETKPNTEGPGNGDNKSTTRRPRHHHDDPHHHPK